MFPVDAKHKDIDRYCVCGTDTIYFNIKEQEITIVTIIGRQNFLNNFFYHNNKIIFAWQTKFLDNFKFFFLKFRNEKINFKLP
jgi:hypothetical protein